MIQLQDLHEGSLLHNLRLRYVGKKIYTYTVGWVEGGREERGGELW